MKLLCISLGCDKNLVDAERMLGSLSQDGYTFTDDEQEADVILVNTCCFINDAKEESVNTILEMAEYKKSGTCKALLVSRRCQRWTVFSVRPAMMRSARCWRRC